MSIPVYTSLLIFEFFANNDYRLGGARGETSDARLAPCSLIIIITRLLPEKRDRLIQERSLAH
jgi:hypothetical protein